MSILSSYAFSTLAWQALQALPLIIWPQAVAGLLSLDSQAGVQADVSGIGNYFARSLGLAQLALGLLTVCLSGAVPLDSLVEAQQGQISPYASATILVTTLHHGATAFYIWTKYNATSQTGFLLGFIGSATMGAFGLWCLMFGGEKGKISKRTGKDKRTSGILFGKGDKKL